MVSEVGSQCVVEVAEQNPRSGFAGVVRVINTKKNYSHEDNDTDGASNASARVSVTFHTQEA